MGHNPPADIILDLFLSCFPIMMGKPILEEDFSNWVQARERIRYMRPSKRETALRWYGLSLAEYHREPARSQQNHKRRVATRRAMLK